MPTVLELREGLSGLAAIAQQELRAALGQSAGPAVVKEVVADLVPGLVRTYGAAAGAYAADWYDELRLELEVRGVFAAEPAVIPDSGAASLAAWGVDPLFAANPDISAAQTLILGGLQRRVANVARATITQASIADPQAEGWQRVGAGNCDFCAMLISRGAVYSEAGADFAAHDHCNCAAAPAFAGQARLAHPFVPSTQVITDAGRDRVNRYLRSH